MKQRERELTQKRTMVDGATVEMYSGAIFTNIKQFRADMNLWSGEVLRTGRHTNSVPVFLGEKYSFNSSDVQKVLLKGEF